MPVPKEAWSSRLGVILAVAGSAVGLGNFLRFPGLAAQYGGGAFMIAYFISLLIIGIPIGWAEWALGRHGGSLGYRSSPGIFHALIKKPYGKYLGVIGFIIPVMIYMYYVYIEAWCLGYALNAATGRLSEPGMNYGEFFGRYTGAGSDGVAIHFGLHDVGLFVLIVYAINFWFIYRGISKGIELVCKYAMPALIVIALIVLARVLTLGTPDPLKPDQNVLTGLGFMWNPGDIATGLKNPQLWLAAAGQIFFSLSVGFGVIITYSSYLTKKDDVVLSGLTASSANEFCEVGLGGLITVPAAFIFLGAAGIVGQGTFGLGFNVLPEVFARMPAGQVFATIFFILLFLAAITSSLSMLQPGIAFLEEGLGLKRKASVALLGLVTAIGSLFVWYFSKDLKALDTLDFWVGTLLIFIQATILIIIFGWTVRHRERLGHSPRRRRSPRAELIQTHHQVRHPRLPAHDLLPLHLEERLRLELLLRRSRPLRAHQLRPRSRRSQPRQSRPALSVLFIGIMTVFTCILVHLSGKNWAANPRAESDKN